MQVDDSVQPETAIPIVGNGVSCQYLSFAQEPCPFFSAVKHQIAQADSFCSSCKSKRVLRSGTEQGIETVQLSDTGQK